MTHFIFDCDDVLLDWEAGFLNWLDPDGTKIDRAGPKSWCLAEWLHCSQMEAAMWVREFNASERFGQLKARPGARELIWGLRNAGHTISVLTACGDNRAVQRARVQNLLNEFPLGVEDALSEVFNQITMLPLGGSKFTYLYEFTRNRDPGDVVFVEDNFEHAQAGWINGIRSYCLRRSHNRLHEAGDTATGVIWIDDLDAIRLDFIPSIQPNIDEATEERIMSDHKCQRCGCALRVEVVQVPVTKNEIVDLDTHPNGFMPVTRYEEREEVSNCPVCTGSY
ncbi:HAD family hydrolase [Aquamicrobium zhengzhouense]|uniref:Uncharacterized protein n=1 Tax=Aquamicrobium zhengzhouense TaxID=2781738 RepID=A0ABS0SBG5_9HYPH|nr:hypothetical protein [Aquamicrobium zhengzhouense]MBI1620051.1 hypothetical protein [Aquamicrobium zhengzhouense]